MAFLDRKKRKGSVRILDSFLYFNLEGGEQTMMERRANIYKKARKFAGLTIEKAAEKIGVAPRTLAGYEKGEYTPPADIVCNMCKAYRTDWLAYEHLQGSSPLGQRYLPEIDFSSLPTTVLRFQKEMADAHRIIGDMVEVTCDGKIDKHEFEVWDAVTKEVRELVGAGLALMFVEKEKAPAFAEAR
jgi:transcriptional regulator with XRE-family HTH domain